MAFNFIPDKTGPLSSVNMVVKIGLVVAGLVAGCCLIVGVAINIIINE